MCSVTDLSVFLYKDSPETLFSLCLDVIVNNINTITVGEPNQPLKFKDDVILPVEICDRLLNAYQKQHCIDYNVAVLFGDRSKARLEHLKLYNANVTDEGFRLLMEHKPHLLELNQCQDLTQVSLEHINNNCENLVSLTIEPLSNAIMPLDKSLEDRGYIIKAPKLRQLAVRHRGILFPLLLLKPFSQLTHLDLSECASLGQISSVTELQTLYSLILYNVYYIQEAIDWIASLNTLRHLDISMSNEKYGRYSNPNNALHKIVTSLPHLESLDISGTNLAGSGSSTVACSGVRCDIPGLSSRVANPLAFLGLYGTQYGACKRHDIPAEKISGDANENQIITAATAYMHRPEMLTRVLNDLYYLFRYENNAQPMSALVVVLDAMEKHETKKHIQISGSATLFYIVKGKDNANHSSPASIHLKQRIIKALLTGMEVHVGDETMMRNGCLTLCQFKIPADVLFAYERVVSILLNGVSDVNQEGFVQRIALYLLNSLACQVDGKQKRFLGNRGTIMKMLNLISDRLERQVCDDVLEVAWSTMWNVTDETPQNCQRFLENRGMHYFLACLKSFPEKDELLRNMMGLLGNVAEVKSLRPYLMSQLFLNVFYDLLNSSSDGIEVSYNAAGVLAHMALDGPEMWTVAAPSREDVLRRVAEAIERWDLRAERNINYRSFEPILSLLSAHHTPQCQHWAVWALANLTTVYPEKYCNLVEAEGGLGLLETLIEHPGPYARIKELASMVIENCRNYALQPPSDTPAAPSPEN